MRDLHVHSTFSDGADEPEAIVCAAIGKGLTEIGFSDHSYLYMDRGYTVEDVAAYRKEILRLKEKYAGKISVLLGIEQDYFTENSPTGYDFVIGSVHYVYMGGEYIAVDHTPEILRNGIEKHFGGDPYALIEAYFDLVGKVVEKTGADIVGHFDLITKFNEKTPLFDETHPRYVAAWKKAADALIKTGKPFEINTGAVARGYRSQPYPSPAVREYLAERGAKFIWSSDSHKKETLCFGFPETEN